MPSASQYRVVTENRRARYDYFIEHTLVAGLTLSGTEVKSLRRGHGSLNEAYAGEMDGELYLFNAFIPEYLEANRFNHLPRRPRKLLVKKKERHKLLGAIHRKGMTLVPLNCFFSNRGWVKITLGVATGKKKEDKRAAEKEKDWNKEKSRILKQQNA